MESKKIIKDGLFITFEGTEGSGKSTQIKLTKEYFEGQGYDVLITREPGGTNISEKIRNLLLDPEHSDMIAKTELFLYAASRAQHIGELIIPSLKKGMIVLCDRFHDSTTAYQGYGRNIPLDFIKDLHRLTLGELEPEITFIFEVDLNIGIQRARNKSEKSFSMKGGDRLEREGMDFHSRVLNGYRSIAKSESHRVKMIKTGDIQSINKEIIDHIINTMREKNADSI